MERASLHRICIILALVPCALPAQDGLLNPGFGTNGLVYTPFASGSHDEAHAVAIQHDGRIIAAGKSEGKFAAARYWSNGALDSTFGTAGKVTTDMYGGNGAYAALVQPDGKIVIIGTGYVGQFGLVRYDTSGALDATFAGSGWTMEGLGYPCYAYGAALQADGKIIVAGRVALGGNDDILVMRFNTNGSLDGTFGSSGIVETDFGGNEEAYGVAIQSDGRIVVVGSNYNADFLVVRYRSNGTIDSTFGTNGKVLTPVGTGYDNAYAVAIQADGKIVVAGYATSVWSNFGVVRYDTSGVLDPTFSGDGITTTWFGYGHDIAYSVAIQLDGKIVAAGTVTDSTGGYNYGVVRYNSDGALDNTFGSGGTASTDLGSVLDYGNAMAIQSDGKIVVAGQSLVPTGRYSFAVAEYLGSSGPLLVDVIEVASVPKEFTLAQNYPNPFNPETEITFALPEPSRVRVSVFDILGREIVTIVDGEMAVGFHHVRWAGQDAAGQKTASGIYFYRITAVGESGREFTRVMKMILAR